MFASLRSKSRTSARRGPLAIRSIASARSLPAAAPNPLSAARFMMKGSIEFDQFSLIPAAAVAIVRQVSTHCAASGPNGLAPLCSAMGGLHVAIAAVVEGGAVDRVGVLQRQLPRI